MKKLLAIFAILAAFSSTAFAVETANDDATASVNVWNPIVVNVNCTTPPAADILIGGTTTAVFTATGTWDTEATGYTAGWTYITPTTTGGTWTGAVDATDYTKFNASLTGTAKGVAEIKATFTVSYGF